MYLRTRAIGAVALTFSLAACVVVPDSPTRPGVVPSPGSAVGAGLNVPGGGPNFTPPGKGPQAPGAKPPRVDPKAALAASRKASGGEAMEGPVGDASEGLGSGEDVGSLFASDQASDFESVPEVADGFGAGAAGSEPLEGNTARRPAPKPKPTPKPKAKKLYVTPVAGQSCGGFQPGDAPCRSNDGKAGAAGFTLPWSMLTDTNGNVLIADGGNSVIRLMTPRFEVSTIAGAAIPDAFEAHEIQGAALGETVFGQPIGLAIDPPTGEIFVSDTSANLIWVIDLANGEVARAVGTGEAGYADGNTQTEAQLNGPAGIAVNKRGTVLYIADTGNNCIREVRYKEAGNNQMFTMAGVGEPDAEGSNQGFQDGTRDEARFDAPLGMCMGPDGNLYVADHNNHAIRKITPAGVVTTYAGNGDPGQKDATRATNATIGWPTSVAAGPDGTLYVLHLMTQNGEQVETPILRVIAPNGGKTSTMFVDGFKDGSGKVRRMSRNGLAVSPAGNRIYTQFTDYTRGTSYINTMEYR